MNKNIQGKIKSEPHISGANFLAFKGLINGIKAQALLPRQLLKSNWKTLMAMVFTPTITLHSSLLTIC